MLFAMSTDVVVNTQLATRVPMTSAAMWDALAPTWDARGDWHAALTRDITSRMVDLLAVHRAETILELAGGPTADAAFEIVNRHPDECRVIASDLSTAMVEAARRRAERRGTSGIEFRKLDAVALELDDRSVDGVIARWVYMLLAAPTAGFREARRVLRPAGRLVFALFAEAERNPFFMFAARVLIERGLLAPPRPGEPSMFALADTGQVARLLEDVGFERPHVEELALTYELAHPDELWSFVSEFLGPVSMALGRLAAYERDKVRSEMERNANAFRQGTGYRLPGTVLVVATTPRLTVAA
jgi:ubiquinone/menaquinone biosynthesis C-methylase UbiE